MCKILNQKFTKIIKYMDKHPQRHHLTFCMLMSIGTPDELSGVPGQDRVDWQCLTPLQRKQPRQVLR